MGDVSNSLLDSYWSKELYFIFRMLDFKENKNVS